MITTLTLNPAMDYTVFLDTPTVPGTLHRSVGTASTQGGKGTNVSLALLQLGVTSNAVVLLGGDNGKRFYDAHLDYGLTLTSVPIAAETRMNIKIIDGQGVCTEFNQSTAVTSDELAAAVAEIDKTVRGSGDLLILSGSVPRGIDKGVYAQLCKKFRSLGAEVIADCDGEALKKCMSCDVKPTLIKPNLFELCGLYGFDSSDYGGVSEADIERIKALCRSCYSDYGTDVLCTADSRGAVICVKRNENSGKTSDGCVSDNCETLYQRAPEVTLRGFTGAGDTFLAAYVYATRVCGKSNENALKFAVSASAAKVELPGTKIPTKEQMEKFIGRI